MSAATLKIGVLAPLTGPAAADGQEYVNGVKWAIDEANKAGGVAGYQFDMVPVDVKDGSSVNVTNAVNRLATTPDLAVVLTGYASLSMFEVTLFRKYGIPYISAGPSTNFAAIVSKDPSSYWCCWSYSALQTGYVTTLLPEIENLEATGKFEAPNKTVALINSDNPYSQFIYKGIKKDFEKKKWKIVVDETLPYGVINDWSPVLEKIRLTKPNLIINTAYLPGNSALFLNQFLENPTPSLLFLQYAPSVPEFLKLTGKKSTGVIYNLIGAILNTKSSPRGMKLWQEYKTRFHTESGPYGIGLYEEAQLYFNALKEVKNPKDYKAIGHAIGSAVTTTAVGVMKFDPHSHVALNSNEYVPTIYFQLWDGERVIIAPKEYANGEFKTPPWIQDK